VTKGVVDSTVDITKKGIDGTVNAVTDPVAAAQSVSDATIDMTKKGVDMTVSAGGAVMDKTVDVVSDPVKAAQEAGTAVADASTAIADKSMEVASEVSSLMMGGIEKSFETLGVNAGFQAVMKGFADELDTSDESLEKQFKSIDADSSGNISDDEMKVAIAKMYGTDLDPKLLAQMMKAADTDNDGEVNLEEFKVIMRAGPEKKSATEDAASEKKERSLCGF